MSFDISLFTMWFVPRQRPHHFVLAANAMGKRVQIFTLKSIRSIHQETPASNVMRITFSFGPRLIRTVPFLREYNRRVKSRAFLDFLSSDSNIHIYSCSPMHFPHFPKPRFLIYDCLDDWTAMPRAQNEIIQFEREICAHADQIWVVSRFLEQKLADFGTKLRYIPNGVNYSHFSSAASNRRRYAQGKKKLVYIGHIGPWFDAELVGQVATLLPDWELLLAGMTDITHQQHTQLQRQNIKILGYLPYEDLPRLLAECTVGMIPFVGGVLARSVSPVKLFEYLAAGLPVVATPMPEVSQFEEPGVVSCTDSAVEFSEAVRNLAENANVVRCQALANTRTWDLIFSNAFKGIPYH